MATKKTSTPQTSQPSRTSGKTLVGVVVSTKMKDTATVAVTRFVAHPKYRKFIRSVKRYHVHDPGNTKAEGDKVLIRECRPLSKTKHFTLA